MTSSTELSPGLSDRIQPRVDKFHLPILSFILCLEAASPFTAVSQTVKSLPWTVEQVAGSFKFVEGPVWKEGFGLLFSDIPANTIYRWIPDSGVIVHLFPSDSSNGLTYDASGRLVLTQMRRRRVSRQEEDGRITPLVSSFRGMRFNCPNDLVFSDAGSLFFTDPDFNVPAGESPETPFRGVYRLSAEGHIRLIDSTFVKPNGICFSPDGSVLYVNESPRGEVYAWDVRNDSTFVNRRLFFRMSEKGHADGMKTDRQGNVYCTGPGGVWVITPKGELSGRISIPETPTNCAWGDSGQKTLFVTARTGVYLARRME